MTKTGIHKASEVVFRDALNMTVKIARIELLLGVGSPVEKEASTLVWNAPFKREGYLGIEVLYVNGLVKLIGDSDRRPPHIDMALEEVVRDINKKTSKERIGNLILALFRGRNRRLGEITVNIIADLLFRLGILKVNIVLAKEVLEHLIHLQRLLNETLIELRNCVKHRKKKI